MSEDTSASSSTSAGVPAPDFRRLFESQPGLYLVLAPTLQIVAVSDAYLHATKTQRDVVLGRHIFDVFPDNPDDDEATGVHNLRASLERVLATHQADTMAVQKYDIRRPEEEGGGFEERHWSPMNSPVLDERGRLLYIIHRAEDVTEFVKLKQAQSEHTRTQADLQSRLERMEAEIYLRAQALQETNVQLREANDDLARHNTERAELNERLRHLDRMKTAFFANMSHELRTPLTLVLGPLDRLLASPELPASCREPLDMAERNARILLKHVNDLLDVSRMDAGKMALHRKNVDTARVLRQSASNFDGLAQERRVRFEVSAPPELRASIDADQFRRIVANLLANAFKFTPRGGTIRCTLTPTHDGKGDWLALRVADSGPGVPREKRAAIFERFYQTDESAATGGTGLGLAIVHDFAELHGGEATVTDAEEGGAAFVVRLPLQPVLPDSPREEDPEEWASEPAHLLAAATADGAPAIAADSMPAAVAADRPRVLVVEDNFDMNRFISSVLAESYQVESIHSASEALDRLAATPFDLVVSDVMMHGMTGEDLLKAIRATRQWDGLPVVMVTARTDDETRIRLLRNGAQDYLTKPVLVDELRARIANQIALKRGRDILREGLTSAEESLEELARAQVARQREAERLRDEAERANRAKDEFLSVVSHELRTPLNVIQGWLWQIKRPTASNDIRQRAVDIIERNVGLQARLVEDILDVSKAAIGKLQIRQRLVDLARVCQAAVDSVERHAQSKNLTLSATVPDAPLFIWGDPDRVQQAISNVISNSMKFTPVGGEVHVSVGREGTRARVIISDTGVGVAPEFLTSMFEPFAQADRSTTRQFGGLGLGLAIVKQIVMLHGGSVSAASDGKDQGTTVTLDFPIPAVLEEPDERHRTRGTSDTSFQRLDGVKVLVVDDEPEACEAVREVLEYHGASVQTAVSGPQALRLLSESKPDVLLSDLAMPEMDGYEFIRRVRTQSEGMLPAAALTAFAGQGREDALRAGFQHYESKPILPADLVTLVGRLASRRFH